MSQFYNERSVPNQEANSPRDRRKCYFAFIGIENADPVGYEVVVKDLWVGSVITVQKQNKEKFTIPIKKIVNDEDVYDATLPYAGYKTHEETSYMEDMFVAFRCPTETYALCAQLPFE